MRSQSLAERLFGVLFALVAVGVALRLIWQLLEPLLPWIGCGLLIALAVGVLLRRQRGW